LQRYSPYTLRSNMPLSTNYAAGMGYGYVGSSLSSFGSTGSGRVHELFTADGMDSHEARLMASLPPPYTTTLPAVTNNRANPNATFKLKNTRAGMRQVQSVVQPMYDDALPLSSGVQTVKSCSKVDPIRPRSFVRTQEVTISRPYAAAKQYTLETPDTDVARARRAVQCSDLAYLRQRDVMYAMDKADSKKRRQEQMKKRGEMAQASMERVQRYLATRGTE